MKKFMEEIIEELVGYPIDMQLKEAFEKNGIDNQIIVTCMLCKKLDRLVDVLENINKEVSSINCDICGLENSLNSLSELSECVAYIPPTYHQKEGYYVFRVAGQIDTN